jgi:CRP-like cAMP-binding protein
MTDYRTRREAAPVTARSPAVQGPTLEAQRGNRILAQLPPDQLLRLHPLLEPVTLWPEQLLCASGRAVSHVYFPTTAIASLVCSTCTGRSIEVATFGAESLVGVTFAAGNLWTQGRAIVERPGGAWRLSLAHLQGELARGGQLLQATLRNEELLKAQMAQTALCSHSHRLDEQLCRWILTQVDRSGSMRIAVTQEHVAGMLGVRREGVSMAVRQLQADGALYWGRGSLQVTDRRALELRCCECYDTLRATTRRVFGLSAATE